MNDEYAYDDYDIEEYDLDRKTEIVDEITVIYNFTSPFSKAKHKERISTRVQKEVNCEVGRFNTIFYGFDWDTIEIARVANPNKPIEDEISRVIKIAYDTEKQINYLYKVLGIKDPIELRNMLENNLESKEEVWEKIKKSNKQ